MYRQAATQTQQATKVTPSAGGILQRKCACGGTPGPTGECEACRKKREAAALQRAASHASVVNTVPPIVQDVLRAPGQPLDAATRASMEPRFGHDFSGVRVHTDATAAESARAVSALAYTVGRDMVFGRGQYAPGTAAGNRLLAHELTHVVQQEDTSVAPVALRLDPDAALERQARAVEAGAVGALSVAQARVLQRNPDEPALCGGIWTCAASPCQDPDPGRLSNGSTATSWMLKVMIDVEAPSAEDVTASTIGHTYVEFADSTGRAYTYGFYPDKSSGTPDPMFKPLVAGCMVHPDTNHSRCVDYSETFTLTEAEFNAALSFAQTLCKAPPPYHLQTWNCTTFAVEVAQKAGKSLPPVRGRVGYGMLSTVADNPYKLYEGLKQRDIGPTYGLAGDTEIRNAINAADAATIARIPTAEKLRIINRLLDGWVSDDDIAAIRKIYRNTPSNQRIIVKPAIEARLLDLTDIGQRTQVRVILAGG